MMSVFKEGEKYRKRYRFDEFQRDHGSVVEKQPKGPTELVLLSVSGHRDVQEHLMHVLRHLGVDANTPVELMSA
jgi:hypothetical protein